jgi:hypothetical protein
MWCVVTIDQIDSRNQPDGVGALLVDLRALPTVRAFERTVGDELQGLFDDPQAVAELLERLLRSGGWHIGLGFGEVDQPVPDSVRAGRGSAFLRAREAVTAAKSSPWHLRVLGPEGDPRPRRLESVAWLWAALLDRRTTKGWQVADLVAGGMSYEETARALGVTPSAISQRAASAGLAEGRRARELVSDLSSELLQKEDSR